MNRTSLRSAFSHLRNAFFLSTLAVGVVALGSCNKTSAPVGDTIVVGEFASMTGNTATFGQSVHSGAVLAIDEINAGGGVIGKKINLISEDDQSNLQDAAAAVHKLIDRDQIVALLGEVASGRSKAGGPIAQTAQVPMISPASTNEDVTKIGDYIFRICFIDSYQGQSMARFALNSLKKNRAAVLEDMKSDYSVGLSKSFRETFEKSGGKTISDQSYTTGDKDFHAQLTSIRSFSPDVIFVPGYYNEVGLIVRQARELGLTCPIIGGDGWDSPELTKGNETAFNDTYFSNHFATEDPDPVVQDFVKKYAKKFDGKVPDAMAALGYDAARILVDAIKRAGTTDHAKLRDAIAQTKDFAGVTGMITIDKDRNASKPLTILRIVDGKFHFAQRVGANGEALTPFDPTGKSSMQSPANTSTPPSATPNAPAPGVTAPSQPAPLPPASKY
jgi:branched-chain amino acid transport system substrate-binding protein